MQVWDRFGVPPCEPWTPGDPHDSARGSKKSTIFVIVIMLFPCGGTCTDGAKAMVGKPAGLSARTKPVAPKHTSSHCVLYCHTFQLKYIKINEPVTSLKNVHN